MLGPLSFQRLASPFTLGPRLLSGFASARLRRFPGGNGLRGVLCPTTTGSGTATATATASKRRIRGRWPRTVRRVHRQTLGLLNRDGVKTASQLDELVMIQRFEDSAVHSGEVKRRLGLHARSESDPDPFGKLESRGKSTPSHFAALRKPGGERYRQICRLPHGECP